MKPGRPGVTSAAAAAGSGVVRQRTIADGDRAGVIVNAATVGGGRIVGQGATADAQRAAVVNAATTNTNNVARITRHGAVADGERADVGNAAAAGAVAGRDGQAGNADRPTGDCENSEEPYCAAVSLHCQRPRAGPIDLDVASEIRQLTR